MDLSRAFRIGAVAAALTLGLVASMPIAEAKPVTKAQAQQKHAEQLARFQKNKAKLAKSYRATVRQLGAPKVKGNTAVFAGKFVIKTAKGPERTLSTLLTTYTKLGLGNSQLVIVDKDAKSQTTFTYFEEQAKLHLKVSKGKQSEAIVIQVLPNGHFKVGDAAFKTVQDAGAAFGKSAAFKATSVETMLTALEAFEAMLAVGAGKNYTCAQTVWCESNELHIERIMLMGPIIQAPLVL